MEKYHHKTFLCMPLSIEYSQPIDDQLNKFFLDYPKIQIVNISYEHAYSDTKLIGTMAYLLYSEEVE